MKNPPLNEREVALISEVFLRHPEISSAKLISSRAKGSHMPHSDVDFAVWGADALGAEAIAADLDDLPLREPF